MREFVIAFCQSALEVWAAWVFFLAAVTVLCLDGRLLLAFTVAGFLIFITAVAAIFR